MGRALPARREPDGPGSSTSGTPRREPGAHVLDPARDGGLDRDGSVEVGGEELTIAVAVGEEGDARHLLESAVLEANSRLTTDDDDGAGDRDADDEAMTRTFRSFAPGA